jgi:hypothetical protein
VTVPVDCLNVERDYSTTKVHPCWRLLNLSSREYDLVRAETTGLSSGALGDHLALGIAVVVEAGIDFVHRDSVIVRTYEVGMLEREGGVVWVVPSLDRGRG